MDNIDNQILRAIAFSRLRIREGGKNDGTVVAGWNGRPRWKPNRCPFTMAAMSQVSPVLLDPARSRTSRAWMVISLVLCALSVFAYFAVDARLVGWIHARGIDGYTIQKLGWIRKSTVTWPGHFACTAVIGVLVLWVRKPDWRPTALLLSSGVFTGINGLFKWISGRSRPSPSTGLASMDFEPFRGGLMGLFVQRNLAFPSGDTALAASTAACLSHLFPRGRILWWALAVIVGAQRIAQAAHHLSDVLAAMALGIVAFHVARIALARWEQTKALQSGPFQSCQE